MDAIKVLWKAVQTMESGRLSSEKNGHCNKALSDKTPRPSGLNGSKISSRSSEHSIAKLVETLETITANEPCKGVSETVVHGLPESASSLSLSTASLQGPVVPHPSMIQSMPPSVMSDQLSQQLNTPQAIQVLSAQCADLQTQVVQLQSSLNKVMTFMSTFTSGVFSEEKQPDSASTHVDAFHKKVEDSLLGAEMECSSAKENSKAVAATNSSSRSPRPLTLPGISTANSESQEHNNIPDSAQLTESALINSPQEACQEVQTFALTALSRSSSFVSSSLRNLFLNSSSEDIDIVHGEFTPRLPFSSNQPSSLKTSVFSLKSE